MYALKATANPSPLSLPPVNNMKVQSLKNSWNKALFVVVKLDILNFDRDD
jgi:hypothetical protein